MFRLSCSGAERLPPVERSALSSMSMPASPKVVHLFLRVLAARRWIAGAFLILAAAGIYGALRVPDDPAIERLVVAGDPIARATLEFDRLFPEGEQVLIMLEAPGPW